MKFTYVIAMLVSLIALVMTKRHRHHYRRNNVCSPPCKSSQFCTSLNSCENKKKKGESCSGESTSVTDQCVDGTSCKKNPVTGKYRCADANNKTKRFY